jgi:uncharacterized protein
MKISQSKEIFVLPIMEYYLLYAPLLPYVSLVNKTAVDEIHNSLTSNNPKIHPTIEPLVERLRAESLNFPLPKQGNINSPFFLGLVTTRNCNMGCIYCDFAAPKSAGPVMSIKVAKQALDSYFAILSANHHRQANVHFFGGEPFFAPDVVDFAVNYAKVKSYELGIDVKYEVITNGFFDLNRAHWIGNTFNTVVLSLDGPEPIQNRNRPGLKGRQIFRHVYDVAKILSGTPADLIIRSCITDDTVERIPEIAEWISQEFNPTAWCLEPLTPDFSSVKTRLRPPDPWKFARYFAEATQILEPFGIRVVNSTVELGNPQISCCPVGRDAIIVSPDGDIDACYLLEKDWLAQGMNMRFGKIELDVPNESALNFDAEVLASLRQRNVYNRALCQDCFCRYSCAGGCHVNHITSAAPGNYDDLCIYTRLITIGKLLSRLGQNDLAKSWWSHPEHLEESVMQPSDRLINLEKAE